MQYQRAKAVKLSCPEYVFGNSLEFILKNRTDKYKIASNNSVDIAGKRIDLFGMSCTIEGSIALGILKGFHIYKPKSLERPQQRVDVWPIYDPVKLANVE